MERSSGPLLFIVLYVKCAGRGRRMREQKEGVKEEEEEEERKLGGTDGRQKEEEEEEERKLDLND